MTGVSSSANHSFGPISSHRVTPTSDLLKGDNYVVPTPSKNLLQLRGPASTPRPQLFPFSTNFQSAISASMLSSHPKQSSKSNFRFASQPTAKPSYHSPRGHLTLGISNSQSSASTSKPTGQLKFHSPIDVGALTSESMSGGISSLSHMTNEYLMKSTRQREGQNLFTGLTKPYIMQLEHPIDEVTVVDPNDNSGGNFKSDEIDLTLKL